MTKKERENTNKKIFSSFCSPLDEPVCLREEIFEANIGDSININCSIDASPSNCTYLWNIPELHLVRHSANDKFQLFNDSTLIYKLNDQLDFGSIKCQATNGLGKTTCEHFVLPKASKYSFHIFIFCRCCSLCKLVYNEAYTSIYSSH